MRSSIKIGLTHIIGVAVVSFLFFVHISSSPDTYFEEAVWSIIVAILIWFVNYFLIILLNKQIPWRIKVAPRIFIQFGVSTLLTLWLCYYGVKFLYDIVYDAHFSTQAFRRSILIFLGISILYHLIFTSLHFFRKWQESVLKSEELKRQTLNTQYNVLKDQVNPHFLFNSINTLLGLIKESKETAIEYGEYFAKVYRYILEKGREETVSLSKEVDIIKTNIVLLESRFGNKLRIKLNVKDSDLGKQIPPLTLHMLLENAIKHNMATNTNPLTIEIHSIENGKLSIKNNIQKKSGIKSTQLGIQNIVSRYSYLSAEQVSIKETSKYFEVILPLLKTKKHLS